MDEAYLIYSPLARERLYDIIISEVDVDDRLILIRQIVHAIQHIHGKGIMHRDIKPSNISIVSRTPPQAQLLDFGSATDDATTADHHAGTIPYLAPEVIDLKYNNGKASYDNAVDVWSLGVTAYQLLCKRRSLPWKFIVEPDLVTVKSALVSSSDVSDRMRDLLHKMLSWSPDDRISAAGAAALLDPLDKDVGAPVGGGQAGEKRLRED